MRRGVLFGALDAEDRGYLYLAMKAFDVIRSVDVGRIIVRILARLRDALKGEFVRLVEHVGVKKAWDMAGYAMSWGYGAAWAWRRDEGFARFFAVMESNAPWGWGV